MNRFRQLFGGEFARQVARLAAGTAAGQLIVVAVTPLLTRLYSPSDLGVFGLFASFVGVASVAVCWRLDLGVATAHSRAEAGELVLLCLMVSIPTSIALSAVLAGLIAGQWLSFGLLSAWTVPLALLALVATGVFGALRFWHVRDGDFGVVSRALVTQGAGRAGTSLALGLAATGWTGLVLGDVLGRLLGIRQLWLRARDGLRSVFAHAGKPQIVARLRAARRYPLIVLPSSVIDALAAALPLPAIATLFGPAAAGQFALVWRVATVPAGLLSSSVADVFHSHAVAADVRDPRLVASLLRGTLRRLAWVAAALFVPLCALSPLLFGWVFGPDWSQAGWLMLLLLPMWWSAAVVSPVSRVLLVVGRPGLKLVFDLCYLVLPLAALYGWREQGLERAVLAYGLAATLAYVLFAVIMVRVMPRGRAEGS